MLFKDALVEVDISGINLSHTIELLCLYAISNNTRPKNNYILKACYCSYTTEK